MAHLHLSARGEGTQKDVADILWLAPASITPTLYKTGFYLIRHEQSWRLHLHPAAFAPTRLPGVTGLSSLAPLINERGVERRPAGLV